MIAKTILTIILITSIIAGCAVATTVTTPNSQYIVKSQTDAIVSYTDDNVQISVDNRGRTPIAETILTGTVARAVSTPVQIDND